MLLTTQICRKSGLSFRFILPDSDFINYRVHDNKIRPVLTELDAVLLPGHEMNLILSKEIVNKLADPYNKCLVYGDNQHIRHEYSSYFKLTTKNNSTYNRVSCYESCQSSIIFQRCNSSKLLYAESVCIRKESEQILKEIELSGFCDMACPFECYKVAFNIEKEDIDYKFLSKHNFALESVRQGDTSLANKTDEQILSRVLNINLFFQSFQYSYVTESPAYSVVDLVGYIGGLLGLYLGISIISVFEILEAVVEMLIIQFTS